MLRVQNLTKVFNHNTVNERVALDNVSLTLDAGDFVTVIGGNGAGKSTLLNCVAGLYPPDAGSIFIDDANVTRLPEYRRAAYLGRVFQDPMMGTAADMNIEENLALAYRRGRPRGLRWGISAGERVLYRQMLETLDLGLETRMQSKVGLLSGGQRQALTLLMATLHKPRLLLLDEHTAALDPKTARKVLELSDRFIQDGSLTTMMVTHNMRDAIRHGNRLIMMSGGSIAVDVSGEEKSRLTVEDLLKMFEQARGTDGFGEPAAGDMRAEGQDGSLVAGGGGCGLESLHEGGGIAAPAHVEADQGQLPADAEIIGADFEAAPQMGDFGIEIGGGAPPASLPEVVGELEPAAGFGEEGLRFGPGGRFGGDSPQEPGRFPRHDFVEQEAGGGEGIGGAVEPGADGLGVFGGEGQGELLGEQLFPERPQVQAVGLVHLGAGAEFAGLEPFMKGLHDRTGIKEADLVFGCGDAPLDGQTGFVGGGLGGGQRM